MPNPDYATLLPQIAAETDPVARQALIDQAYQFNEPLTQEEINVFAYIEDIEGYVNDGGEHTGFTEYVGTYFDDNGDTSEQEQPLYDLEITNVELIDILPTRTGGDEVTYTESIPLSVFENPLQDRAPIRAVVTVRANRVVESDEIVRFRVYANGGGLQFSASGSASIVSNTQERQQEYFNLNGAPETSEFFQQFSPITFTIREFFVLREVPGTSPITYTTRAPTIDDPGFPAYTIPVIDDRTVPFTPDLVTSISSRTETSTHFNVFVFFTPSLPTRDLQGTLTVKAGVLEYTFPFTVTSGNFGVGVPINIPHGTKYFSTNSVTLTASFEDADDIYDNLLSSTITLN